MIAALVNRYRVDAEPLRSERRVELACLLLAVLFALQLLWLLLRALGSPAPEPILPAESSLNVDDALTRPPLEARVRQAWLARPLFWEGRRPLAEVVVEEKPEEPKAGKIDGVSLLGLFGSGEQGGAIIAHKDRQQRLQVGEEINGWTLESLDAGSARFVAGERATELVLERRSGAIRVEAVLERAVDKNEPERGELTLGGRR